jgi:chemotaxis response regulator CheB
MNKEKIKVFIIDDSLMFRGVLRRELIKEENLDIVGTAKVVI